MTSIEKNRKYHILLPSYVRENKKINFFRHLPKNVVANFYHSIKEIINISKKINIDLLFVEDKILNIAFEKIKNCSLGIILIYTGKLKKKYYRNNEIFGLIQKENLSYQLLEFSIEKNIDNLKLVTENKKLKTSFFKQEKSITELHDIGISLSKGNDIDFLLETIIDRSMQLTSANGGSLHLIEENPNAKEIVNDYYFNKQLRQIIIKNATGKPNLNSKNILDLSSNSICGDVVLKGEPIIIDKLDKLDKGDPYHSNAKEINKSYNFIVKSILTVPIFNNEKLAIGAIQLVNRKKNFETIFENTETIFEKVVPFEKKDLYFLESIASQASIAIRNTNMMKSIHILFDGFINASVRAIESRDPTTSGHSSRVATLTLGLAETINRIDTGKFASLNFNKDQLDEIRYASLLHDFGKIGVRERVLIKSKKLYPDEFQSIMDRFNLIKALTELNNCKKQISFLKNKPRDRAFDLLKICKEELYEKLEEIDEMRKFIIEANEPSIIQKNGFKKLNKFAKKTFQYPKGNTKNFLSEQELNSLAIKKGSLNDQDRKEIESHVTHTFNFLKVIPWSKNLERVPEIAHAHHEKLNGMGYPSKLEENQIPVESKMMAIADIYDALTAWDRPYKKAISKERALDILYFEAKDNHIDQDLLDIFVDAKLYSLVERNK